MKLSARIIKSVILALSVSSIILYSCKRDLQPQPQNKQTNSQIEFKIPKGWPEPVYNFTNNPLTEAGFNLGKKLFFDPILSRTNTISCGTCHQPFAAFSQIGHDISHGVEDRLGNRNSPSLFNLNWHTSFFWDGGVNHIEMIPINPITNPLEMDEQLENVIEKLTKNDEYPDLFEQAFGSYEINTQRIFKAISLFTGMLVSADSKYDKYIRNEVGGNLTHEELSGLKIFRDKCSSCHTEPLFSDFTLRNNGLELVSGSNGIIDAGRGVITPHDSSSYYLFKVPSLRNLKYSPPYMHDGRFNTIDEVLKHYEKGIHNTKNLDPILTNGIQFTSEEKENLKSFLNTLNDEEFVKNPLFRN